MLISCFYPKPQRTGRLQPEDPDDPTVENVSSSKGTSKNFAHMFALVGSKECHETYPALSELLENLESLPYEMNKKKYIARNNKTNILTQSGTHSCAVSRIRSGEFARVVVVVVVVVVDWLVRL